MAEAIYIPKNLDKKSIYESLIPQLRALIEPEPDLVANLANTAAVLKEAFGFFWVGFYLVRDEYLVLGPFQGPVACTRIQYGKGVCGKAWEKNETLIVPDVTQFPGHIACSAFSRSEIVVPLTFEEKIVGVLDIDSSDLNHFDEIDALYLKEIVKLLV